MKWYFPLLILIVFAARADEWKPVTPAELSQKEALVEKDADAEAIFWEVRVGDQVVNRVPQTILSHYIRIKIFTNRGRDRLSTLDIPVFPGTHITSIAGRTIHPDGGIVELKKDGIFERVLARTANIKIKHESFTMPAVEPGSIIEYRWNEEHDNHYAQHMRLDYQRDIPIQTVHYWVKPYSSPNFNWHMVYQDFHCDRTPFQKDINGYYVTTLRNVPAFKEEPNMPPANELRAWTLIYYKPTGAPDADKFWIEHGKATYNRNKGRMKVGKAVQQKAAEIVAKAKTDEEKALLLVDFCKNSIRNTGREVVSAEEREDAARNKTPDDTLNQGMGTDSDIRFLFGALASASGLESRIAELPDRQISFFERRLADTYFLNGWAIAVKIGDGWRIFDPSATFVPRDMVAWNHEGVEALVSDPKEPFFITVPVSRADKSIVRRRATFKMTDDGSIDGRVTLEFNGHPGAVRKERSERLSEAQREEVLKSELKYYAAAGEFTDIKIENTADPEKPLTYSCHLRVPGYAQRTGKRLFFVPSFFQQGATPRFPLKDRKYPIYFHYPFVDDDRVTFELPPGFEFEEPRVPAPLSLGKFGKYEVHARILDKTQFVFERRLEFADNGNVLLPVNAYPVLKAAFDTIAKGDEESIGLKQAAAPAAKN